MEWHCGSVQADPWSAKAESMSQADPQRNGLRPRFTRHLDQICPTKGSATIAWAVLAADRPKSRTKANAERTVMSNLICFGLSVRKRKNTPKQTLEKTMMNMRRATVKMAVSKQ